MKLRKKGIGFPSFSRLAFRLSVEVMNRRVVIAFEGESSTRALFSSKRREYSSPSGNRGMGGAGWEVSWPARKSAPLWHLWRIDRWCVCPLNHMASRGYAVCLPDVEAKNRFHRARAGRLYLPRAFWGLNLDPWMTAWLSMKQNTLWRRELDSAATMSASSSALYTDWWPASLVVNIALAFWTPMRAVAAQYSSYIFLSDPSEAQIWGASGTFMASVLYVGSWSSYGSTRNFLPLLAGW